MLDRGLFCVEFWQLRKPFACQPGCISVLANVQYTHEAFALLAGIIQAA
jgi:hypothetical protein